MLCLIGESVKSNAFSSTVFIVYEMCVVFRVQFQFQYFYIQQDVDTEKLWETYVWILKWDN